VRLPYEVKELFAEWLKVHRPERANHVLSLIRQTRGGKLYDADFSQRRKGTGAYAELIKHRFAIGTRRLGYNRGSWDLNGSLFRAPEKDGQITFSFA
jgi:DNA repair photolyase